MLLQQHDYSYSSSFICSAIPSPKLDLGAVYQLLTSGVGTLNGVFSCHQKLLHDLLSLQTGFFQPWDGFHVFLHVGSVASSYLIMLGHGHGGGRGRHCFCNVLRSQSSSAPVQPHFGGAHDKQSNLNSAQTQRATFVHRNSNSEGTITSATCSSSSSSISSCSSPVITSDAASTKGCCCCCSKCHCFS